MTLAAAAWYSSGPILWVALAAIGVGLAVLLATALTGVERKRSGRRMRRRLSHFSVSGRHAAESETDATPLSRNVARTAVELAERIVTKRGFESELTRRLEAGGLGLRPAEWLILHLGTAIVLPLLLGLLTGKWLLVVVGLVIGVLGPFGYLSVAESRRKAQFAAQLPNTLQMLAGTLSAGYSLPHGVDTIVQEGQEPIATEFRKAVVEARLGVPMEDALDSVADRMKSTDFAWVVMAIRVQREVGGNLGEILTTVSKTLREREYLRRQVKALSAEGRLSAYILGGLPIVFGGYLLMARGDYLHPLFHDPMGLVMLVMMAVLFVVGVFWLRKIVRVEA